ERNGRSPLLEGVAGDRGRAPAQRKAFPSRASRAIAVGQTCATAFGSARRRRCRFLGAQLANLDPARGRLDADFEMLRLHDLGDADRSVGDDVASAAMAQAVVKKPRRQGRPYAFAESLCSVVTVG